MEDLNIPNSRGKLVLATFVANLRHVSVVEIRLDAGDQSVNNVFTLSEEYNIK